MREDDAAEDFAGKLLTLIVADDTDLNLLLMTEILVIAHLARDEGMALPQWHHPAGTNPEPPQSATLRIGRRAGCTARTPHQNAP